MGTEILTIPRTQTPTLPESGCWSATALDFLQPPLWQPRTAVEQDERYIQPIVYLVLLNPAGQAWCYQRKGGDGRLDGRWSCGVGGHVDAADAVGTADAPTGSSFDPTATLQHALLREAHEELGITAADLPALQLRGLVYEGLSAIGRVHLGVLYTARWLHATPPRPCADEKLVGQGFVDLAVVASDLRFELWSRLACQFLQESA